MTWGALLTDQYGNPWVTPETTPMSLVNKIVINANTPGVYILPVNASSPFVVACHSTVDGAIFWISKANDTYGLNYSKAASSDSVGTVTIYIFGIVIPQSLPKFGIAIWNAAGQCILTNETKVMPAPQSFGTIGNANDTGYFINKTVSGKFAVIPKIMGQINGTVNAGGQIRPVSSAIDTGAYYNGSSTRLYSGLRRNVVTGAETVTYANSRDLIYAIDVSYL